jgi:hypothetical protein
MDYGRRYANVQATAGDIADAATVACEDKLVEANTIKPSTVTNEFAVDRARRNTIRVVVEERAKARK